LWGEIFVQKRKGFTVHTKGGEAGFATRRKKSLTEKKKKEVGGVGSQLGGGKELKKIIRQKGRGRKNKQDEHGDEAGRCLKGWGWKGLIRGRIESVGGLPKGFQIPCEGGGVILTALDERNTTEGVWGEKL